MSYTSLFGRKFGFDQHGLLFDGKPIAGIPRGFGTDFYVDSATGAAGSSGLNPTEAISTIDAAIAKCTANKGDRIIVLPGHSETISAAAGIACDVAGISIIGLGEGATQPVVTLDTADTTDVNISAAGVTIENIHFKSGFADIVNCIDVDADDFTIRGCRFTEAADDENFLVCIQDAAAGGSDRITIENCIAIQDDASNTHFVNFAGTGTGHRVVGNTLHGDWGTMAIGGAGVITYCDISHNRIGNLATTVDGCINLAATATGVVTHNICAGGAAQANGVTATACVIGENYYGVLAEDLSAILDPIAT